MADYANILTGGSNNFQTTAEHLNNWAKDILTADGVVGTPSNTSGVAPMTGGLAVNAQGTPDMTVAVTAGQAYVTATPSGQASQRLRANIATQNVTIAANASGSTKYDWLYVKIDPTNANNPNAAGDNVASIFTSRSSSSTTDNGTPPTYGYNIAVVTVVNGAASIANGSIADKRSAIGVASTDSTFRSTLYNYVESGCVWSGDSYGSTLNASMTSGVVWIGGVRLTVPAVTARAFTLNQDTYVDLSNAGNGTATIAYTGVSNNSASPALSAGSLRIGIIVAGATSIAAASSINQGQEDRVLPIASSIPYTVTDSLGNLICPRTPTPSLIGYRQITSNGTVASATPTQITGLSCPVIVPTGRKVKISSFGTRFANSTTNATISTSIWDGVVNSGTKLQQYDHSSGTVASDGYGYYVEAIATPTSSSKTYNLGASSTAGTATITASSTTPAWIKVELV